VRVHRYTMRKNSEGKEWAGTGWRGGSRRRSTSSRPRTCASSWQGLTLVNFSAHPEPFLTQKIPWTPLTTPNTC
jgi:hypothetical protein